MTTRQLPTDDEVRLAMDLVLRESAETGRRPTITAVEQRLDIAHPTFYRNYPEPIDWFKQQVQDKKAAPPQGKRGAARRDPAVEMARLRRENTDLRTLTKLYAEAIRQLTLDYAELEAKLNAHAGVTTLDARRKR
jgi:hypothetical protein